MSQRTITGPADLTPAERKHLRYMRDFWDSPPTLARIYARVWPAIFVTVLLAAVGVAVAMWFQEPFVAATVVAVAIGMLLRDVQHFQGTIEVWPASRAIIDRERLDELLGEPPDDNYS